MALGMIDGDLIPMLWGESTEAYRKRLATLREGGYNVTEEVVTNPLTGGMKGAKDSQLSVTPPRALDMVGRVNAFGSKKYERHNFRKGYAWSLSYDALERHINASLAGEDYDPESGLPHMAHAAWHCLTLVQFLLDKEEGRHPPELDDRYVNN